MQDFDDLLTLRAAATPGRWVWRRFDSWMLVSDAGVRPVVLCALDGPLATNDHAQHRLVSVGDELAVHPEHHPDLRLIPAAVNAVKSLPDVWSNLARVARAAQSYLAQCDRFDSGRGSPLDLSEARMRLVRALLEVGCEVRR